MELVEVAIVAVFRQFGVSLQRIRRARQYAAQRFQVDFPFVQLSFKTEGHHMLLEYLAEENDPQLRQVIVADSAGQLAWETLMADKFAEFDYEHGLALIWHVAGRESPISIDPRIAFGAPTVRGIPTWVIKGRWDAGESFEDIEDDFGVPRDDVVSALRFEGIQEAA